jgi:hypothetical protein
MLTSDRQVPDLPGASRLLVVRATNSTETTVHGGPRSGVSLIAPPRPFARARSSITTARALSGDLWAVHLEDALAACFHNTGAGEHAKRHNPFPS